MEKSGFPLRQIKDFPEEYLIKLAKLNVTTAEEFVSLTNTEDKREKIAQFLEVQPDKLSILIKSAKESLPKDIAKEMETPIDTTQYPLGALKPENK